MILQHISNRNLPTSWVAMGLLLFLLMPVMAMAQDAQQRRPSSGPEENQADKPPVVLQGREVTLGEETELPEPVVEEVQLKLAGTRLHLLRGEPAGGTTRSVVVLLLHGARFSSETWRELGTIELLARQGYLVWALDLPGFGQSQATETKDAEFLRTLLPLITARPVVVVSPSMSGRYSLPFVVNHASYLAGFVPVAPGGLPNYLKALMGSKVPTLIVWGEDDKIIPLRQAEQLHKAMANSRKIILAGAKHPCYLDNPIEFHRELLQFLARL